MVKLTVLYNLPEGADHKAFLKWRTTTHQQNNASNPGVLKTDFYMARDTRIGPTKYRYITEVYFASMEELEKGFLSDEGQARLQENLSRIADPVFLISEEVVTTDNTTADTGQRPSN